MNINPSTKAGLLGGVMLVNLSGSVIVPGSHYNPVWSKVYSRVNGLSRSAVDHGGLVTVSVTLGAGC